MAFRPHFFESSLYLRGSTTSHLCNTHAHENWIEVCDDELSIKKNGLLFFISLPLPSLSNTIRPICGEICKEREREWEMFHVDAFERELCLCHVIRQWPCVASICIFTQIKKRKTNWYKITVIKYEKRGFAPIKGNM